MKIKKGTSYGHLRLVPYLSLYCLLGFLSVIFLDSVHNTKYQHTSSMTSSTKSLPPKTPVIKPVAFKSFSPPPLDGKSYSNIKMKALGRRSKPQYATIIPAKKFNLDEHVHVHPARVFGDKKIKMVKLSPTAYTSAKTRVPVRVQFSGSGSIPFACKADKWGKTHVNLGIEDTTENEQYAKFAEDLTKLAYKNRAKWWPKHAKTMTMEKIKDNFLPPIFAAEEKKDTPGEFWAPNIRVKVPISMNSGEPVSVALRANQKACIILDHDDAIVSIHDLAGRRWNKAIVDLYGIYFNGKYGWGIGPYCLSRLQLEFDSDAEAAYQQVQFIEDQDEDTKAIDDEAPAKKRRKTSNSSSSGEESSDGSETEILTQEFNFPDCPR